MKTFKQLRNKLFTEAYSRNLNDKDVDKQFKSMRDPEGFYGDLDKARADMKKAYHPGNSARPKVWTSLAYPVRDGDYYFAFIDKNEKNNIKYNQKMNDALKQAFKGGDKKSEDDMWSVVSRELQSYPRSLGWNDTMTREELWGAIQHMLGKIKEDVSEVAGIMTPAGIKKGKRKMAPKYLKNSVNEKYRSKFPSSLVAAAVKIAIDMGGNMTGAYKKIEKMKKGLADDSMVQDALRQANESVNESLQENVKAVMKKHKKHIDKWKRNNKPMPIQVEDDLMQAAMKAGEIKTDDPDEFDDWLDRNL